MLVQLNNFVYDVLSRLTRYYIPLLGVLTIIVTRAFEMDGLVVFLSWIVILQFCLGMILLLARHRWRAKDILIIDDRDPESMSFGFDSGRLLDDLQNGKIMVLKIRKLSHEYRAAYEPYSDHQ